MTLRGSPENLNCNKDAKQLIKSTKKKGKAKVKETTMKQLTNEHQQHKLTNYVIKTIKKCEN